MNKILKFIKDVWNSNVFKIILILVIVFLVLIDYWNLSLFSNAVQYEKIGTVGDWFSNFATLITIVFAAITIRNDKLNVEKERTFTLNLRDEEERKRIQEEKEKQELLAQSVYAWVSGTQDPVTKKVRNHKICIANKTEVPIFEWKIYNLNNVTIAKSITYGPIFPEGEKEIEVKGLENNIIISIVYRSFLGKCYYRTGGEVREVADVDV